MRPNSLKKSLLGLVMTAALVAVGACGGSDGDDQASEGASDSSSAAPDGIQADLSGVPDVVALVNDVEISKDEFEQTYTSEFEQASMQAQAAGQPVDQDQLKKQVAERMVGTELLRQEAQRQGFEVSDADVDKELSRLAKENGLKSADQFLAALKKQGLGEDDVRAEVSKQEEIKQLLDKETGGAAPTEAELRKLYDQVKKQQAASGQKGGIPPFEKARPQLVEQVESQKQNAVAEKLITTLRKSGEVTINL